MAEIIGINQIRDEKENVFAIRQEDGELKPLEEWDGVDWEELVEGPFVMMANSFGVSKWDVFAQFISQILTETMPTTEDDEGNP